MSYNDLYFMTDRREVADYTRGLIVYLNMQHIKLSGHNLIMILV